MGIKRLLTLLLLMVKGPFFWLCKAIFLPIFSVGYWAYRGIRKRVGILTAYMRDRAMVFLANRYAIHAIVIVLAFGVTATNLYASEGTPLPDNGVPNSILGDLTKTEDQILVIEEANPNQFMKREGVAYLGDQALSLHDATSSPTIQYISASPSFDDSATENEGYIDDERELLLVSPTANAVRFQPGAEEVELPTTRTQVEQYVVKEGDTIGSIARSYGLRTETLLASNGLTVRSLLRIGQTLSILPVDGISYKVKSGDTIAKIAQTYNSDVERILEANNLAAGAPLSIGQELILPDGRTPAPPAPKAPARIATSIKDIFIPPPSAENSGSGSMIWPTAARRITQYYGNWLGGVRHTGVDIAGPTGTAIYAADDGVVSISGWNTGGYGNMVLINHGNGVFTRYGHGSKLLVQAGDTVKKGDVIMLMGSTGRSTGPHLHFEVMVNTPLTRRNPLDYVKL